MKMLESSWIKNYANKLYTWLLPFSCILCGQPATCRDLCQDCQNELPIITHSCRRCANPLPQSTYVCGECQKEPPPFDATYALCRYERPIIQLILRLKFQQSLLYARILGELLANKIQHDWYQQQRLPDVIIPMPLHPQRLRERGFNQALEIARPIAKQLHLPLLVDACQRTKYTTAQATLPAKLRKQNVTHAFTLNRSLAGKHIAVIDDVITTGHTMTELCQLLKKYGVQRIDAWCAAKSNRSP